MIDPSVDRFRYVPFVEHGRSRDGVDCYGGVRLYYAEEFGIELPSYTEAYASTRELAEIHRAISGRVGDWIRIEGEADLLLGDVAIAWTARPDCWTHVGLYVGEDSGHRQILSWHDGHGYPVVEAADVGFWRNRIVGWFRHPRRALPALREAALPDGFVTVTYVESPFATSPLSWRIAPGKSLEEIVAAVGLPVEAGPLRVIHNDQVVKEGDGVDARWALARRARPKAGSYVIVRPTPEIPIVIAFVIAAAEALAAAAAGFAAGAVGGISAAAGGAGIAGAAGTAFTVGAYAGAILTPLAISSGISIAVGQIAKSVGAPSASSPTPAIGPGSTRVGGSFGNELRPRQVIPFALGELPITPHFAARAYSEFDGDKEFTVAIFMIGQGRYKVTDVRIGDVPIEELAEDYADGEVELHVIEGGVATGGYVGEIQDDVLGNRPIHYYRLDEVSGSVANDVGKGTETDLTITGGVTLNQASLLTGDTDQSMRFDGTTGRLTTSARALVSNLLENGVELWVAPEAGMAAGSEVCLWSNGDETAGWGLYLFGDAGEEPKRWRVRVFGSGGSETLDFRSAPLAHLASGARDGIYHVFVRWRGTKCDLWVDGAARRTKRLSKGLSLSTPAVHFSVGAAKLSGGSYGKFFKGRIDELASYDKSIDQGVIFWHRDKGKAKTPNRGGNPRFYTDTVVEAAILSGAYIKTPQAFEVPWSTTPPPESPPYPGKLISSWTYASLPGNVDRISWHWSFPLGFYRLSEKGGDRGWESRIECEFKRSDEVEWASAFDLYYGYRRPQRKPFFDSRALGVVATDQEGIRWETRLRVRWDVRPDGSQMGGLTATGGPEPAPPGAGPSKNGKGYTGGHETSIAVNDVEIHSIKGARLNRTPVTVKGVSLLAVRLPKEAAGTLTCFVRRVLEVWNGSAFVWSSGDEVLRAAWCALTVLRDPEQNPRPIADSKILLSEFLAWAPRSPKIGVWVDYQSNTFALANQIAGLGFASLDYPDGLYGVCEDLVQTTSKGLLTPRNTRETKCKLFFSRYPHALLVSYYDRRSRQQNQMEVYDDGYNSDGSNGKIAASEFEALDVVGLVDSEEVHKFARIRQLLHRLRNEEVETSCFLDQLPLRRGVRVEWAHPVALIGQRQQRVVKTTVVGPNTTEIYLEEKVVYQAGKSYAATWWRSVSDPAQSYHRVLLNVPANNLSAQSPTPKIVFSTPVANGEAPGVGDLVAFGELNAVTAPFTIRAIRPTKGLSARVELFPFIDGATNPDWWRGEVPPRDPVITLPPPNVDPQPAPANIIALQSDENWLRLLGGRDVAAHIAVLFRVQHRRKLGQPRAEWIQARSRPYMPGVTVDNPWETHPAWSANANPYVIGPFADGETFELEFRTVSERGVPTRWQARQVHRVIGRTTLPPDVSRVRLEPDRVTWQLPTRPLDVEGFRVKYVRGNTEGRGWDRAVFAHDPNVLVRANGLLLHHFPSGETLTVLVKAVDQLGLESRNAGYAVIAIGGQPVANVVQRVDHQPAWTLGTFTSAVPVVIAGGSVFPGFQISSPLDEHDMWVKDENGEVDEEVLVFHEDDEVEFFDEGGDAANTYGFTYEWTYIPDSLALGKRLRVTTKRADPTMPIEIEYKTQSHRALWSENDQRSLWDKNEDGVVDVADDNAPLWDADEEWSPMPRELLVIEREALSFQIRVRGKRRGTHPPPGLRLDELAVVVDVDDLTIEVRDFLIPEGGSVLPGISGFFQEIKTITLGFQFDARYPARTVQIKDKATGQVECRDSSGNPAQGVIDAVVQGIPAHAAIEAGLL